MFIRTYSELEMLHTFEERYQYLKLNGNVGEKTFGFDRYLNQIFYLHTLPILQYGALVFLFYLHNADKYNYLF